MYRLELVYNTDFLMNVNVIINCECTRLCYFGTDDDDDGDDAFALLFVVDDCNPRKSSR